MSMDAKYLVSSYVEPSQTIQWVSVFEVILWAVDVNDILKMTEDELEHMAIANPRGHVFTETAIRELERRNRRRLAESIERIKTFAAGTEKSGRRMEVATWVLLFATLVQSALIVVPMLRKHQNVAASQTATDEVRVNANTTWANADVTVMCSKERLLPFTALDHNSKKVILNCTIKNPTDKAVPLSTPDKVDAFFLLRDGEVARGSAYLGSSQHEIPAHGEIVGGLFPGGKDCPIKESDHDCVQEELMNSKELLLTDTVMGLRYHVLIE